MLDKYNKKCEAITFEEWGKLVGDKDYKVIRQDTLPNGKWVSTVWLGIEHGFVEGKPLIFETMVFPKRSDYDGRDMERYCTEQEAIKGHQKMMKKHS